MSSSRQEIYNEMAKAATRGKTSSQVRAALPHISSNTIGSSLSTLTKMGHLRKIGERRGDKFLEIVYCVTDPENPYVERRGGRKVKREAVTRSDPNRQPGQGKPNNADWIEGYTDALLGRPSALSHYSEGYLAGVNARASR